MGTKSDLPIINLSFLNKGKGDFLHNNFAISDTDKDLPEDVYQHPTIINAIFFGICVRGKGKLHINLNEYEVDEESVVVLIPGTILQCHLEEVTEDFLIYYVTFSDDFIKEFDSTNIYSSLRECPCMKLEKESTKILLDRYFSLQEKLDHNDYSFRKEILQYSLLADIYEFYSIYLNHMVSEPEVLCKESDFQKKFFDLIYTYYGTQRKVQFYADKLCLSPKYLSTKIKDLTNKTVTEWIIESLILKAKALLKSTEMNIQELSDYFNFSDASAFGKFFKKNVKMTPNEYRKNED